MTSPNLRIAGLLAAAAIVAGACGTTTVTPAPTHTPKPTPVVTPAPTPTPTPAPTQLIVATIPAGELVTAGQLTVCSDVTNTPQEFLDASGKSIGSDVDLAGEIATRLGLRLKVLNTASAKILAALAAKHCDIIISAQPITPTLLTKVDMIPYFQAGQAFVVAKGNPAAIKTSYDLCNKTVSVRKSSAEASHLSGTTPYNPARGLLANCLAARMAPIVVKTFATDSDALAALIANKVVAYFTDSPMAGWDVALRPTQLDLVPGLVLGTVTEGISVTRNQNDVYAAVRLALQSMIDDGTYLKILTRYGVQAGAVASTLS
jgi:polar amino acid transport system substrate-binding protein